MANSLSLTDWYGVSEFGNIPASSLKANPNQAWIKPILALMIGKLSENRIDLANQWLDHAALGLGPARRERLGNAGNYRRRQRAEGPGERKLR
jgi:hypothetical protein